MSIPIFVSTKETQGQRDDDHCSASEGDIVIFSIRPCDDIACICNQSMTSIESKEQTFTTTMKVSMFSGTIDDLDKLILRFLRDEGWVRPAYVQNIDKNFAARLSGEASKFSIGTIVEYRDGVFTARKE